MSHKNNYVNSAYLCPESDQPKQEQDQPEPAGRQQDPGQEQARPYQEQARTRPKRPGGYGERRDPLPLYIIPYSER
jgi:hypothetical protein